MKKPVENNPDLEKDESNNAVLSSKKAFENWKRQKEAANLVNMLSEFVEEQRKANQEVLSRLEEIDKKLENQNREF